MSASRHVQVEGIKSLFDDLIDRHAEAYMAAYPEIQEFSNYEKSGTFSYYIGMVWTSDYERPNKDQFRIRGSQVLAKNKLLELDLSVVDSQQSFFPGQIVAFHGDPFLKKQLTVRRFLDPMRIAPSMKKIDTDDCINLLVASGPFIKQDQENDWTLYENLIESIKSNNATHVILIGPFVDLENKHIRANYDISWKQIFGKLVEGLCAHKCHVFLVPSHRDVLPSYMSSNYFYPCSKLNVKLNLKEGAKPECIISSVDDPAQIDLGGIFLDVTSAEVLLHLNNCASYINKGPGNPFNSLFRHILSHGIYPIYPPPPDVAIDFPKLGEHLKLDRLGPHIVVLPTKFNIPPVSIVENRLVLAVPKSTVKKQAIFVEIPKIESAETCPIDTVALASSTRILSL